MSPEYCMLRGEWTDKGPIRYRRAVAKGERVDLFEEEGEAAYVRYSALPASGKSYNYRDKCYLEDISVWRAVRTKSGRYVLWVPSLREQAEVTKMAAWQRRPAFEVKGRVLEGTGPDGEPLLRDCVATPIQRDQIVPLGWSEKLMYEILSRSKGLRRELQLTGQIHCRPTYNETKWRRMWGGEPRQEPIVAPNTFLPYATNCARLSRLHGIEHWTRVATIGEALAKVTAGADGYVVGLFAAIHDTQRRSDGSDPEHGPRAAALARRLHAEGIFEATDEQLKLLIKACEMHTLRDHIRADYWVLLGR